MNLILNEEELKFAIHNVANTEDGFKLLGHLISESGAMNKGYQGNARDGYIKGRADFGIELIEYMKLYAFDKFAELLKIDTENLKKELN